MKRGFFKKSITRVGLSFPRILLCTSKLLFLTLFSEIVSRPQIPTRKRFINIFLEAGEDRQQITVILATNSAVLIQ